MAPRGRATAALAAAACLLGSDGRSSSSCHEPGECPATGRGVSGSGFTNATGWAPDGSGCCDICEGAKRVNCFDKAACGSKTGDGDWDFLILDQIWLPQFCRALSHGHDPTLTHMPDARCLEEGASRKTGLSIHGLWPNYVGGYPQCCSRVSLPQEIDDDIRTRAEREWVDPTTAVGDDCGVCKMWAHETMKHGSCLTSSMQTYMRLTLDLLDRLKDATVAANAVLQAASRGPVATKRLTDLFLPFSSQMLCDPRDPNSTDGVGIFLELRTCWNRTAGAPGNVTKATDLEQVDCPKRPVGSPCPELIVADAGAAERLVVV